MVERILTIIRVQINNNRITKCHNETELSFYSPANLGRRAIPQGLLQMLSRRLHPDNVLLRGAQRRLVLQDPFLAAVHGEGELQPHEEEDRVPGGVAGRRGRGGNSLAT
jgi:hypothetical protein